MTLSDQSTSIANQSKFYWFSLNIHFHLTIIYLKGEYSSEFDAMVRSKTQIKLPEFPLLPASRGFCLTVSNLLDQFQKLIESIEP